MGSLVLVLQDLVFVEVMRVEGALAVLIPEGEVVHKVMALAVASFAEEDVYNAMVEGVG